MKIETSSLNGLTFIEVTNNVGLKVVLSTFGAGIYEITLDGVPMTSCEKDRTVWATSPSFAGKTVGRIAGRIKDGILNFEGRTYQLDQNERGVTCHHGGDGLFAFSNYRMDSHLEENGMNVDFYKIDDHSKFPGKLTHRVRYIIPEDDTFVRIEYKTTTDVRTPVNFTSHTYLSLGEDCLDDMLLQISADEVEAYDEMLIATGLRKVPDYLDWRIEKPFKSCLDAEEIKSDSLRGLDHAYKFKKNDGKKAVLTLKGTKYVGTLITSLPAVQVYSYNFPSENEMMNNGLFGRIHGSLAVEPMYIPGDYEAMAVDPNTPKTNYIEYHFKKIK